MSLTDRINRANARSRRVPSLFFRVLIAWFISAIVLAVLVPALHTRDVEIRPWMVWVVILATLGLCVGPDLISRIRRRRP
jgi:hypothetical protein